MDETQEAPRTAIVSSIQLTVHAHVGAPVDGEAPVALPTVAEVSEVCRKALDEAFGNDGRVHFTISGAMHV